MSEKFIPPTPNLAGDDVLFARYVDGQPKDWGHMHKDRVKEYQDQGQDIRIVDASWQPPPVQFDQILQMRAALVQTLNLTDKYFTSDALDNINAETQTQWREYRQALRDAAKKTTMPEIVALLPTVDPKGYDAFSKFR